MNNDLHQRMTNIITHLPADLTPDQQAAIHARLDEIEAITQGLKARIAEGNPHPIIVFSATGEVLYANPAATPIDTSRVWDNRHKHTIHLDEQLYSLDTNQDGDITTAYLRDISAEIIHAALFEKNNDGVFIISLEGEHLAVNQRAVDILGYSVEELLSQSMEALIVEEERGHSHSVREKLLAGERLPIYQRRFRRKDGVIIPVELNVALVVDETGTPLHFQSIMRDVTLRQEIYDALLDRRRKLQMIIEAMPDTLLLVNSDLTLISFFAPSRFPTIWKTPSPTVDDHIRQILPDPLTHTLEEHLSRDTQYPSTFEHQIPHQGGRIYVEVTISRVPMTDEFLITIHDATRLRQTALELSTLEERQRIARDLHDGATQHLSAATLMMDVLPLLFEKKPEQALDKLVMVSQLVRAAFAEMRMLLHELRPDSLAHTALSELIKHLVDSSVIAANARATFNVTGTAWDLPPETNVAIYRIVQEALNNIAKHANASHVSIQLAFTPDDVRVTINDNGDGFDVRQVPAGHFGLSFMDERAEAADLTTHIESEQGRGTTITVYYDKEHTNE